MTEVEWLEEFGDNLFRLMYEAKMTQAELALATGLSKGTISKYLNKQHVPTVKAIINIAYALECEVSDLIDFGETIEI